MELECYEQETDLAQFSGTNCLQDKVLYPKMSKNSFVILPPGLQFQIKD